MRRVPHLPDPDHAVGPADERGILLDQFYGRLECVFGSQHIPAIAKQIDAAGDSESIYGYIRAAIWRISGRNASSYDSPGNTLLFAPAGVHQWANQRCRKAMSFSVLSSVWR